MGIVYIMVLKHNMVKEQRLLQLLKLVNMQSKH